MFHHGSQTEVLARGAYDHGSGQSRAGLPHLAAVLRLAFFVLGGFAGSLVIFTAVAANDRFGAAIGLLLVLLGPPLMLMLVIASRGLLAAWEMLRQRLAWWHGLWLLVFVSSLVFRVRDVHDAKAVPIDAWALLRLLPEALVGLVLISRLLSGRTPWLQPLFRGLVGALAIYSLVSVVSTAWSVYPTWTLYKSCEYLLDVILLAAVLATVSSEENFKSLFDWTWLIYGLGLIWVWAGAVMWPREAWQPPLWRLSGVFPVEGSNSVGTTGAILAVVAINRLLWRGNRSTNRSWYTVLFTLGFVTMLASQTRNAIAGFLFGLGVLLLASKRKRVGLLLVLVLVPLFLFTGLGDLTWGYLERGQDEGRLASLTGRVGWWSLAWQQVVHHPWTGLGAYAGGRFAVMDELGLGGVSTLHSDYLEVLVGTSFWGLLPFVAALFGTWWFLARNLREAATASLERRLTLESLGVIAVLTVHSFFNTDLVWHAPLFFLLVVGYAEFLRRKARPPIPVAFSPATAVTASPKPLMPEVAALYLRSTGPRQAR